MTTKVCSSCGVEKLKSEFGRNSIKRDGLCAACKVCRNARKKRHYYANREQEVEAAKAWNLANPERVRANKRASYRRHKDRLREKSRSEYVTRRDEILAANTAWRRANRAKCAEIKARRRSAKLQRTPKWLSAEQKSEIFNCYRTARDMTVITCEPYHVDHVVPLQGEGVCGLHVPWNLQIVPGRVNNAKYNKLPAELEGWVAPDGRRIF